MEQENSTSNKARTIADIHWSFKLWNTDLHFMDDEITFIDRLLNSNAFKTNTPNLFERLQNYRSRISSLTAICQKIKIEISAFIKDIDYMDEDDHSSLTMVDFKRFDKLEAEVKDCLVNFQNLKAEIFHYAGGVLKMRSKSDE
jgi:hypothetical protein